MTPTFKILLILFNKNSIVVVYQLLDFLIGPKMNILIAQVLQLNDVVFHTGETLTHFIDIFSGLMNSQSN
jgi:hypothetical protein